MKFCVFICCLLVGTNLVAINVVFADEATEYANKVKESEYGREEIYNKEERWMLEFKNFDSGHKIKNENGELVELKAVQKISDESQDYIVDKVLFFLYTRQNPIQYQNLIVNYDSMTDLEGTNFDPTRDTVFITHGFADSGQGPCCTAIRDEYLKNKDLNVIVVDWGQIAKTPFYSDAALKVEAIGKLVARMIIYLQTKGNLDPSRTTLVGFSLGAHVMGIAGYNSIRHNTLIKYIFGLDPAKIMFKYAAPKHRISTLDAEHVQIIHTNGDFLGFWQPIGHSDFYPNGGSSQVGCEFGDSDCHHARAWKYFAESIDQLAEKFGARHCDDLSSIFMAQCPPSDIFMTMGGYTPEGNGTFFLTTFPESPYASGGNVGPTNEENFHTRRASW